MTGYRASLDYLYSLEKSGIVFGLENISWLLRALGNPERDFSSIHVGGTNGKGSVVCMLAGILESAGYRTGMYTSPHLVDFNERIRVNGEYILHGEVTNLTERMRRLAGRKENVHSCSFFDFTTAMAFLYFKEKKVDWAVVEVGLGGRLDSTNVVRPAVSVITNVEMDHMEYLGDDITQIASEKAGIVKEGTPVVTGASGDALRVIREKAAGKSRVLVLGEDFSYRKLGDQCMSYQGLQWDLKEIKLGLQGDHQLGNAALALCSAELLSQSDAIIPRKAVDDGLLSARWPGRLEIVSENPTILLDAAHNPHGAASLASFLKTHYGDSRKILVFGVMKDKNWRAMLNLLSPLFQEIILTKPAVERAASPEMLASTIPNATMINSVEGAILAAKERANKNEIIVVTGSLYTIGEAKTAINEAA